MEYRGVKNKVHATGPNKKREEPKVDKEQMLEKAQEKINHLTKEITKLRSEQEELDEVIESLKNKVNTRDAEIERLTQLLTDGRPLMAARNQCPCCSPQLLDCRLLAKNKQLSEQLEETKQKQHEAMIRAMELAEKNQILEEKRIPSTQTPRSDSSKKCCCAENSNKICKLQVLLQARQRMKTTTVSLYILSMFEMENIEKFAFIINICYFNGSRIIDVEFPDTVAASSSPDAVVSSCSCGSVSLCTPSGLVGLWLREASAEKLEERILQVERLEQELTELKMTNANVLSDKLSVDKILEITLEDKKRMHDRINELTIIEHDLMLEIERLQRTNALQKSQLAELEAQATESVRVADSNRVTQVSKPNSVKATARPGAVKPSIGSARSADPKRPGGQPKKVVLRPVPVAQPKVTKRTVRPPPVPHPESDSPTSISPPPHHSPTSPTDWKEQLLKERKQFKEQLHQIEQQQVEHCAKFHPPPCPRSARAEQQPPRDGDSQSMLLERIQAERDYYHKEFTRLRDQLCNIPDHSTEMTSGPASPHAKLERLLSERDYYFREMCRLRDATTKTHTDKATVSERPTCCVKHNCFCTI
ncbi:hypothetical protein J6590_070809 [Homalodisca vitripennis]|nr:hypothetical protein J6590_070809 [Homalodisca vitripennis]